MKYLKVIDENDEEIYLKLKEAEEEIDSNNKRYSEDEVLESMKEQLDLNRI